MVEQLVVSWIQATTKLTIVRLQDIAGFHGTIFFLLLGFGWFISEWCWIAAIEKLDFIQVFGVVEQDLIRLDLGLLVFHLLLSIVCLLFLVIV